MGTEPERLPPAVPLHLVAPPVALAAAAWWLGVAPAWGSFALGALGWIAALMLRPVLAAGLRRVGLGAAPVQQGVVLSSGPLEEGVRLGLIVALAAGPGQAVWLGLGWALAEAAVAAANAAAFRRALGREDAVGEQARAAYEAAGPLAQAHPGWAALERGSATAAHVGFALAIAWSGWLALPAAAAHTGMNVAALVLAGRSVAAAEAAVLAFGAAALGVGIVLWA